MVTLRGRERALVYAGASGPELDARLVQAGLDVEHARSAAEALDRAARGRFGLIVCPNDTALSGEEDLADRLHALQPQAQLVAAPAVGLGAALAARLELRGLARGAEGSGAASEELEDWTVAGDAISEWSAMVAGWAGLGRERVNRMWLAAGLRRVVPEADRDGPGLAGPDVVELVRVLREHGNERWDGGGPRGRRGPELPEEVRILAVAETIARWLPSPMADEPSAVAGARRELLDEAGLRLDPSLVALALEGLS